MSRVLLELLDLAAGKVHTATVEHPRVELRLEVTDPRNGKARVLPPGPDVLLVDATGKVIDKTEIAADGRVRLLGETSSFDVALEIDFVTLEWLDLDADHYVAEADVTPNDPRPLLRLPRRWRSRAQSAFSDDRGGLFGGGSVLHLEDGKLGTEADPWVLRIDHGWKKFALELRYINTVVDDESLVPAGPVVRALYDGAESKRRLAAASTVLDTNGLVAVWVFDAKPALADLRIVMRTADASYIDMGDGVVREVSRAKHRAMLPKARARLHALPARVRLDQQPAEQGAREGNLATLLSSAGEAPNRVLVRIDRRVELRLVLHDPLSAVPKPIPAGIEVALTDDRDKPIVSARTGEDGRATFFVPPASRDVGIEVDFSDAPFFDLVANTMVAVDEVRANTKRRLLRLPDRWRSSEQQELSDDRGGLVDSGRVSGFAEDSFGRPDAPWELELSHGWQRLEVVFQFYDVDAKDVRPVVFGPVIEAFDDSRRREKDLAAASTVLDASGRVHLAFFRPVEPANVRLQFRTAEDSVVVTTEVDPELRVQRVGATKLAGMLIPDRQRNYPLPSLWLSRGQACRTVDSTSAGATLFESAIDTALTTAIVPSRLFFDLDDFVLVNASGVPIGFARELDVTVFHNDMSIRAPKGGQEYFSDIAAASNHFAGNNGFYSAGAGPEKVARVVRRGKRFYDLQRQRTRRGRLIGVRAAVAGDHPHEHIYLKHEPGTKPNLANCDLHYFEDVASDPTTGRTISVLMVFFSVRIRRLRTTQADRAALQEALVRAAERWGNASLEGALAGVVPKVPDIRLQTDDGKHDVKFVFHFPAFDDQEGHAVMWLVKNVRAFSGATVGLIAVEPGDAIAGSLKAPKVFKEAGAEFGSPHELEAETIAHELGHAMGLGDEYYETFFRKGIPHLPRLRQHDWNFVHLSFDDHSLMHDEFAPRLRHFWVFSRWLARTSDVSRVVVDAYSIGCDTKAVIAPTKGRKHAYRLPADHPWPYQALRVEEDFAPGSGGQGNLGLYLLGDDLDVHRLPHSGVLAGVDAVLHWDVGLYFRRTQSTGGKTLSRAALWSHTRNLYEQMADFLGTIRRSSAANVPRCTVFELDSSAPASPLATKHVTKVVFYFLPRFTFSRPASADFRVHVRPQSAKPGADVTDFHDPSFNGRRIRVHENVRGEALARYILGKGASGARPGAQIDISTTPLPPGPTFGIGSSTSGSKVLTVVHGARTPGADDYDGSGPPAAVAASLAEAINDSKNSFASHIRASAHGATVELDATPPGADIEIRSPPPGTLARNDWAGVLDVAELQFLADWLGKSVGAKYRVKVYD